MLWPSCTALLSSLSCFDCALDHKTFISLYVSVHHTTRVDPSSSADCFMPKNFQTGATVLCSLAPRTSASRLAPPYLHDKPYPHHNFIRAGTSKGFGFISFEDGEAVQKVPSGQGERAGRELTQRTNQVLRSAPHVLNGKTVCCRCAMLSLHDRVSPHAPDDR